MFCVKNMTKLPDLMVGISYFCEAGPWNDIGFDQARLCSLPRRES